MCLMEMFSNFTNHNLSLCLFVTICYTLGDYTCQRKDCIDSWQEEEGVKSDLLNHVKWIKEDIIMLGWVVILLIVAIIAGLLGFTTIAGAAVGIAKILFYLFVILFIISLIMYL